MCSNIHPRWPMLPKRNIFAHCMVSHYTKQPPHYPLRRRGGPHSWALARFDDTSFSPQYRILSYRCPIDPTVPIGSHSASHTRVDCRRTPLPNSLHMLYHRSRGTLPLFFFAASYHLRILPSTCLHYPIRTMQKAGSPPVSCGRRNHCMVRPYEEDQHNAFLRSGQIEQYDGNDPELPHKYTSNRPTHPRPKTYNPHCSPCTHRVGIFQIPVIFLRFPFRNLSRIRQHVVNGICNCLHTWPNTRTIPSIYPIGHQRSFRHTPWYCTARLRS